MLRCITGDTCAPELKLYAFICQLTLHALYSHLCPSGACSLFHLFTNLCQISLAQSTSVAEQHFLQSAMTDLLVHMPDPLWIKSFARNCMLQIFQGV